MTSITVVDLGFSNLFSVVNALNSMGVDVDIAVNEKQIQTASRLIFPGVGAFPNMMDKIKRRNLGDSLKEFYSSQRPILGICLGMQLFFSKSEEFGSHSGLDFIAGEVIKIPEKTLSGKKLKTPNIGWSELKINSSSRVSSQLFHNIRHDDYVYLVHSFYCSPVNKKFVKATIDYGGHEICVAIQNENLFGTQFHPEKSGLAGIQILKNFLRV